MKFIIAAVYFIHIWLMFIFRSFSELANILQIDKLTVNGFNFNAQTIKNICLFSVIFSVLAVTYYRFKNNFIYAYKKLSFNKFKAAVCSFFVRLKTAIKRHIETMKSFIFSRSFELEKVSDGRSKTLCLDFCTVNLQ